MKRKTIAVTGANGFIGTSLCSILKEKGYEVISITPPDSKGRKIGEEKIADITDEKMIVNALEDADITVHLAAISNPRECAQNFEHAYKVNVYGTLNVIKATKSTKMIFASTAHVYGFGKDSGISEDDPLLGESPYAITKIMAEHLCKNYSLNFNSDITRIRLFNIYGERQNPSYVIPSIVSQAVTKRKISIRSTRIIRDFLYVTDAAEAIISIMEKGRSGAVYNIGSGKGISILEIINYVSKTTGGVKIEDLNLSGNEPEKMIAEVTKLKELGWKQKVILEKGIDRMIKYLSIDQS